MGVQVGFRSRNGNNFVTAPNQGGYAPVRLGRSALPSLRRLLGRVKRVLQFVPPAAQAAESPQARAELGSDNFFNHVVATGGGGAQALLR